MKVYIRADGSALIGLGHLTRTLALAKLLKNIGFEPIFIIRNISVKAINLIEKTNIQVLVIPSATESNEIDFDLEFKLLKSWVTNKSSILLIDHYGYKNYMFSKIKTIVDKLVVIDDFQPDRITSDIDLVINPNISANNINYKDLQKTTYLLGTKFALLREPFIQVNNYTVNKECKNILIVIGGTDNTNLTFSIIDLLIKIGKLNITAVLGYNFQDSKTVNIDVNNKYSEIVFKKYISNMAQEIIKHDLAIVSASTISLETLSLGLPTLVINIIENQRAIYEELLNQRLAVGLGEGKDFTKNRKKNEGKLKDILSNHEMRKLLSERSQQIINKKGSELVAQKILNLL